MEGIVAIAIVLVVVVVAYLIVSALSKQAPPAPVPAPKPFGLEAFEAQGLQKASADVVKAVVATISFLGHPFVVAQEAVRASAQQRASEAMGRDQIAENLREITTLQEENIGLDIAAQRAGGRAAELDELVNFVNSVVGGK